MENDRTDIEFTFLQEDFHENHKISSIKYQTEWTMTNFEPNIMATNCNMEFKDNLRRPNDGTSDDSGAEL
jgi:hypothetical protein